jgi:glycosyltransferase involved in cell wall biosynthesis
MHPPKYTMVMPVRHYRLDEHRVAIESAFAEHLRMMLSRVGATATPLVVASPAMSTIQYQAVKQSFSVIDESSELITFCTLFSDDAIHSIKDQLLAFPSVMRTLHKLVRQSQCVHSGLSWNVWLPFEFVSILFGLIHKKRTVFVVDIDYRLSAYMSYRSGTWSRKSYLACKYFYDAARSLQVWFAARNCSLVLLKGKEMAEDFGGGRPNVKSFLDASHSEKNILGPAAVARKIDEVLDHSSPVRLIYFGRLTAYKGVDLCLRAAVRARQLGANVTLDIVGGGEQAEHLSSLIRELAAEKYVTLHGPRQFNQAFFDLISQFHLLLAAPLREDTPRSVLDAMAAGVGYLAFDTYYYRQLLESGAGRVVSWLDVEAIATALAHLTGHRSEIAEMIQNAVGYARANTQEIWLERRLEWTMDASSIVTDRK